MMRYDAAGFLAVDPNALGLQFAPQPKEAVCAYAMVLPHVAEIKIKGPLCNESGSEWLSYDQIVSAAAVALANADVQVLLLDINSPGGDVYGCFDAARELRAMVRAAGKRCVAFTGASLCSAAYALACGADEIVAAESATVGHVGVIHTSLNTALQNAAAGVEITVTTSGPRKADGHPAVAMTDDTREALQNSVNVLAAQFYALVTELRSEPSQDVRTAATYHGSYALAAGVIDRIASKAQLMQILASDNTDATIISEDPNMDDDKDEARKALVAASEDKDEAKAARAKRALAAYDAEDDSDDEKAEDDKEDEQASAAAEDDKEDEQASAASALAASNPAVDALAELHKLRAEIQRDKQAAERVQLLASRPDFSAEFKAELAKAPIETVRSMVAKLPRGNDSVSAAVNAQNVTSALNTPATATKHEATAALDAAFGRQSFKPDVKHTDVTSTYSLVGKK